MDTNKKKDYKILIFINIFLAGFSLGMLSIITLMTLFSINVVSQLDDINMSVFKQECPIIENNCDYEVLNKTLECERDIFKLVQYYEVYENDIN